MTVPPAENEPDPSEPNPYSSPGVELPPSKDDDSWDAEDPDRLGSPPVWLMAGCIVVTAAFYAYIWVPDAGDSTRLIFFQLESMTLRFARSVLCGVGIALLFHAMMRRQVARLMPGHWLAIAVACTVAAELFAERFVDTGAIQVGFESFRRSWIAQRALDDLATSLLFAGMAIASFESSVWRGFAGVRAFVCLLNFVLVPFSLIAADSIEDWPQRAVQVTILLIMGSNLIAFALFVAGLVVDWRDRTERDLWHWLGIVYTIASITYGVVAPLLLHFLFPLPA